MYKNNIYIIIFATLAYIRIYELCNLVQCVQSMRCRHNKAGQSPHVAAEIKSNSRPSADTAP